MFDFEIAAELGKYKNDAYRKFAQEARWTYDYNRGYRAEIEDNVRTIARLEAEVKMLKEMLMENEQCQE